MDELAALCGFGSLRKYVANCVNQRPSDVLVSLYSIGSTQSADTRLPAECFLRGRHESFLAEKIASEFQNWVAKRFFVDPPQPPNWAERKLIRKNFRHGDAYGHFYLAYALRAFLCTYDDYGTFCGEEIYTYDGYRRSELEITYDLTDFGLVYYKLCCAAEYFVSICLGHTIPDYCIEPIQRKAVTYYESRSL